MLRCKGIYSEKVSPRSVTFLFFSTLFLSFFFFDLCPFLPSFWKKWFFFLLFVCTIHIMEFFSSLLFFFVNSRENYFFRNLFFFLFVLRYCLIANMDFFFLIIIGILFLFVFQDLTWETLVYIFFFHCQGFLISQK